MRQVTQNQKTGEVRVEETPSPILQPGGVLVRTAFSLVSAGTERAKVDLARRSLIGKAKARPEQVRQVLRAFRDQGFQDTYRRVTNRLSALEPLGYSCSGVITEVRKRGSRPAGRRLRGVRRRRLRESRRGQFHPHEPLREDSRRCRRIRR